MSNLNSPSIQGLSWEQIKSDVAICNKKLFDLIEAINPKEHHSLYKVQYPFGSYIAKQGRFCLPITKDLDYAPMPVGLLLNKSCEVFIEHQDHLLPLTLLPPGQLIELNENLLATWSISAGGRSLFMLPKITDIAKHRTLMRAYKTNQKTPKKLTDHWQIFADIAQAAAKNWQCEILFFSADWLSKARNSGAWVAFHHYLHTQSCSGSTYLKNKALFNASWEMLAASLVKEKIKIRPVLLETIKQLSAISYGFTPGYQAAGKDESLAPIAAIEAAYTTAYSLKEYLPIVMHPQIFGVQAKPHLYYSLSIDTLYEGSFSSPRTPRIVHALREVKQSMETIQAYVDHHPSLRPCIKQNVDYHYFHMYEHTSTGIQMSEKMPMSDPDLYATFFDYTNRSFPSASPFTRGCIRITLKDKP